MAPGTQMTKRERIDAALAGREVDRVPVSAWRHFIPEESDPPEEPDPTSLAEAHLSFFRGFDWDWLKVNPRATYYAEAFGARYDFGDYAGVFPRYASGPLDSSADLAGIRPVSPTGGVFGEQLELLRLIKRGIGDAHFVQTVFSPLSVLGFLGARADGHPSAQQVAAAQPAAVRRLIDEDPAGVHLALSAIAETLAGYASAAIDAGASGLFYAIVRLAREGVLTPDEYATFGRPYDLRVLEAVQGAPFNMLHVCGSRVHFELVSDYPVHAINWAAVGQGNPDVGEALRRTKLALIGGVDETGILRRGSPAEVVAASREAIRATGGRRFLLAPGCGVGLSPSEENLRALRRAVEPEAGGAQDPR